MKRRLSALALILCFLAGLLSGCGSSTQSGTTDAFKAAEAAGTAETGGEASSDSASAVPTETEYFTDGDYKDVSAETPNATIRLEGDTGVLSDTTRGSSGSTVTITSKGIYRVTGVSEGVTILINERNKSGNIYLLLDSVQMENTDACIYVEAADKVILQCVGDSSLTSTAPEDAAVFSRDDLTLNGSAGLTISSGKHGIEGKDSVKITGASLTVEAAGAGLKANDAVCIDGGDTRITSGKDGVQVDSDAGDGYFYMASGALTVQAGYDGIDVGTSEAAEYTGYIRLAGGTLDITAGGGSAYSKGDTSQKGLKCDGDIFLEGTGLSVSSADDAVNGGGAFSMGGGTASLSSSDDGVSVSGNLLLSGGELTVSKSYEGLEAQEISVSGGSLRVYASDDGVNAAGGSDSGSAEQGPWGGSGSGVITVSGGSVYVNADGDGLDSNGSIYVTGGTIIVEGPSNSGNGALDKGRRSGLRPQRHRRHGAGPGYGGYGGEF